MPNQFTYSSVDEQLKSKIKINEESGCWEWQASLNQSGYGHVGIKGKVLFAHRASYALYKGEIPDGLMVCHHCDNPPCINPDHLFLGTAQDNMDDMYNKGRRNRATCPSFTMYSVFGCRCPGCIQAGKYYRKNLSEEKKASLRETKKQYRLNNLEAKTKADKERYDRKREEILLQKKAYYQNVVKKRL